MNFLYRTRALFILPLLCLAACAGAPRKKPLSPVEQIREDRQLGDELRRHLEAGLKVVRDKTSETYLQSLADKLKGASEVLKESVIHVRMIETVKGDRKWRNVALPGSTLYLSLPLVRQIEHENALAAVIAIEEVHVVERHLVTRVLSNGEEAAASLGEVWTRTAQQEVEAIPPAVELLYRTGYDPRGLVELWRKFQKNPAASPYGERDLSDLVDETYRAIARYSPLRNPVVTSNAFIQFRNRVGQL